MKKMVLIVAGLVVIAGVVLIGRPEKSGKPEGLERAHRTQEEDGTTEYTEDTEKGEGVGNVLTTKDTNYTNVESEKSADGQTGKSAPQVSDAVKALLGMDGKKHNYPSLLSAINALGDDMSSADVTALMKMLNFSNDQFPEKMRPIEINAVKNDVLDKLLRQKQLSEGLGLQLVEMAGNTDNDPVWRDYCIQFMTPAYERLTTAKRSEIISGAEIETEGNGSYTETGMPKDGIAGESDGDVASTKHTKGSNHSVHNYSVKQTELTAIHDAMFAALNERDATLAGTALIGLELLSRTHDEFDRETIVSKATEIAGDEMASSASRLTALRLSAGIPNDEQGMANVEVVEAARSLAQTGETVLLRSAAIVTLGEIGTEADRELLVSYITDGNRQIVDAAKMALEKMDQEPSAEPVEVNVASKIISEPQIAKKAAPILIHQDIFTE